MKKTVLFATGLAMLSSTAYATKARMSALGQTAATGSFYLNDTRNVFRNAAELNNTKNYVVVEWGDGAATTVNAEGGFFKEAGAFNYGVYLGSDNGHNNSVRTSTTGFAGSTNWSGDSAFIEPDNSLDLFFAGDMGVQWGVKIGYERASAVPKKYNRLTVGLGMNMGDLAAYANIGLNDEAEYGQTATKDTMEGSPLNLGLSYGWKNWTFFADHDAQELKLKTDAGTNTTEQTTLKVGAGHIHEVSSSARINMDITYSMVSAENVATNGDKTEKDTKSLPIVVGVEADANDWLTLRGSISQNFVFGESETKTTTGGATVTSKATTANSTAAAAGFTLNYGKLQLDGTFTSATSGKIGSDANFGANVAMHYWF